MSETVARLEPGNGAGPRLVGPVNLGSVSTLVYAADELFANGEDKCTIDLSDVQESDSATVALLLEWKRRAAGQGCELVYSSIPEGLLKIARISQLDDILAS